MYSVLIVDDEQPVIESISFMIQKYRPEIRITGTATSGREAIQKAEEAKPDIILIDVKMPGIDGLEALREIKRRSPNILPILTTAYERFDIAQTAFELGVQDYILKPFSRDKLIGAIDAAVESLDQRSDGRGDSLKHIELYHTLSNSVERLFFRAIKMNSEVNDFAPYLHATLSFKTQKGCIGILEWSECRNESAEDVGNEVISRLKYKFPCLATAFAHEILFFFPQIPDGKAIPDNETITALIDKKNSNGMKWEFATGECVNFEDINESYLDARRRIHQREALFDANQILLYSKQWRKELEQAIYDGDAHMVKQIIMDVLDKSTRVDLAEAVLNDLMLYVEHINSVATGFHIHRAEALSKHVTWKPEDLFTFYLSWSQKVSDIFKTTHDENIPAVLSRALDYINLNYSRPLQLSDVAEKVDISAAYLSNLFSRHLRKSFVDHLTQIRIEKAKKLLKEHTYSIKEISSLVGYQDPNYFSRLFKRQTGVSPTEFS